MPYDDDKCDDHDVDDDHHHDDYNDDVDDDGDDYDGDSHHLPIHIWFPSLCTCKMSCANLMETVLVEKKLEKFFCC